MNPPTATLTPAPASASVRTADYSGAGAATADPIQGRVLDAAVLGAGVAGLSAAWVLQKAGVTYTVLEAGDRVGGKVGTHRQDGYQWEAGPNTIYLRDRVLIDLVHELDGDSEWTIADPKAMVRYLAVEGRLKKLPAGPLSFLFSSVLGPLQKLRLLSEPLRHKGPADNESVADFARRRLGAGALQNLVAPFVSGIYAGDPEQLEAASVFPSLVDAEQAKGSILRGMLAAPKKSADQRVPSRERLRSFHGGMQTLADLLARKLAGQIRLKTAVRRIEHHDSYYLITTAGGEVVRARQLIVALPVDTAAQLLKHLPGAADLSADLAQISACRVCVVSVGLREDQLTRPRHGFGYLTVRPPQARPNPVLGCLWPSCMFAGRAPQGRRMITMYIGGALHPEACDMSDVQLRQLAQQELARTLGMHGDFELFSVERWEKAIPQYTLGHRRRLDRIQAALRRCPSLALAGNYLNGVSVVQAIESGRSAAEGCRAQIAAGRKEKVNQ